MWDGVAGGLQALIAAFIIGLALRSYFSKPKLPHGVRLPPSPRSLSLLGSALEINVSEPWVTYRHGEVNMAGKLRGIFSNIGRINTLTDQRWQPPNLAPIQAAKTHDLLLNMLEYPKEYPEHLEGLGYRVYCVFMRSNARRHDSMIERATSTPEFISISNTGATITPNLWAMCHNEEKYPNASDLNPDRFMNLTDDTVSMVWGFGRGICPGRHLAEASMWSAMACLLSVYNFSKAKDETGREIGIKPKWHGGLTVRPVQFPCSITPRDAEMDLALQQLVKTA